MGSSNEDSQETWEVTTGGTFWVYVKDPRQPGGWAKKKVGGKAGARKVTLTVAERVFNEDLVPEENHHLDPFRNGLMIRISPGDAVRGQNELSDKQLIELLQISDDNTFEAELKAITSEVIARRLLELAAKHTSMWRHSGIQHHVDDKYRVGKTSQVVREIYADDAKYADADL